MPALMIPLEEQDGRDLHYMDLAVRMAEEALQRLEIPVGCVLVKDDKIIATGRNKTNEKRNATMHAEFVAMSQLFPPKDASLSDTTTATCQDLSDVTLYVTVEPCLMCAAALRQARVGKVIFGCANERFGGCGGVQHVHDDKRLKYSPPIVAVGGYRREEAIMLLRRFYVTENAHAPKPKNKGNRVLKFDIPPLPPSQTPSQTPSRSSTPAPDAVAPDTTIST